MPAIVPIHNPPFLRIHLREAPLHSRPLVPKILLDKLPRHRAGRTAKLPSQLPSFNDDLVPQPTVGPLVQQDFQNMSVECAESRVSSSRGQCTFGPEIYSFGEPNYLDAEDRGLPCAK